MTTTPTVWKSEFTVNAGATAGTQSNPVTIGLADGRFFTAWVDATNNVDDDPGSDIIGRIFDADANDGGTAFQLNAFFADNEQDPALAAVPGGFVLAYEGRGTVGGGDASIRFSRFNLSASGAIGTIASGTIGGVEYSDPSVAVLANGDYVVSYEQLAAGAPDIFAKVVNGVTNVVGGAFDAAPNTVDADTSPDTTVLSNGNIVTVYEEEDAGLTGIEFQINTPGGGDVDTDQIVASGTDPNVAALTGGGFVVVWRLPLNATDIRAEIRNNVGGIVTANFLVAGGANSQNEPDVVALKDGGFFVAWDDDTANQLLGQRYNASGTAIGSTVTIATGAAVSSPELGLADDGRILVTFSNSVSEIAQVILDPRDDVIVGDSTSETITSRIDGASVNGGGGNDRLLGQAAADVLIGGTGSDHLEGAGGNDVYYVDNGGDSVHETGGNGVDIVSSSITFSLANAAQVFGAVEDLVLNGNASVGGTGNTLNNVLTGNSGNNVLDGGGGSDVIRGWNGIDQLTGGQGTDTLIGGLGNDWFTFNAPLNVIHRDIISDFFNVAGNNDTIRLENSVMTQLVGPGGLPANNFFAGGTAHDADDHILYNQANGGLYYDSNGNGFGGVTLLAYITNEPVLTAADFVVI